MVSKDHGPYWSLLPFFPLVRYSSVPLASLLLKYGEAHSIWGPLYLLSRCLGCSSSRYFMTPLSPSLDHLIRSLLWHSHVFRLNNVTRMSSDQVASHKPNVMLRLKKKKDVERSMNFLGFKLIATPPYPFLLTWVVCSPCHIVYHLGIICKILKNRDSVHFVHCFAPSVWSSTWPTVGKQDIFRFFTLKPKWFFENTNLIMLLPLKTFCN